MILDSSAIVATGVYRLSTNHRSMTAAVSSWPRFRAQMG